MGTIWTPEYKRQYDRNRHKRHAPEKVEKVRQHRRAITRLIADKKAGRACAGGESHPAALDFHHRDPATKGFSVGDTLSMGYSLARVQAEIDKCELICSNCHRKQHWKEKQDEA